MVRREFREHVFKMLFQIEFIDMEDMPEHISLYLDYLESAGKAEKEQIKNKLQAVIGKVTEIDGILNKKTTGWKTTRMNKVDLTILRLATYEMKWDEDIPTGVAINEAVELAKRFSGDEGPSFVNGVLAKLAD
ncbi:transcription antitermination factor NusB [Muricomes intestini]|uniref:Transcription antitermination protein NusB n=1 Tax=Muricomes intestini TaxID=1796634 RepID=A0A4R3K924_9FIRM|nr:transcription antitermination factor NusB [Muricomes intestini]TCS79151.1 NusB antitermination factor [Muricomes intestini]HAX51466.1 transcription antitermination factor NusB [Lachnospiraceae bacterium]HCR84909.1 transcription antitermination factor NusB [Lachnospiraceae bacterium]